MSPVLPFEFGLPVPLLVGRPSDLDGRIAASDDLLLSPLLPFELDLVSLLGRPSDLDGRIAASNRGVFSDVDVALFIMNESQQTRCLLTRPRPRLPGPSPCRMRRCVVLWTDAPDNLTITDKKANWSGECPSIRESTGLP